MNTLLFFLMRLLESLKLHGSLRYISVGQWVSRGFCKHSFTKPWSNSVRWSLLLPFSQERWMQLRWYRSLSGAAELVRQNQAFSPGLDGSLSPVSTPSVCSLLFLLAKPGRAWSQAGLLSWLFIEKNALRALFRNKCQIETKMLPFLQRAAPERIFAFLQSGWAKLICMNKGSFAKLSGKLVDSIRVKFA